MVLEHKRVTFYVPAKQSFNAEEDAIFCAALAIRPARERERKIGRGQYSSTVIDRWDVVGVEGLTSAGFYLANYIKYPGKKSLHLKKNGVSSNYRPESIKSECALNIVAEQVKVGNSYPPKRQAAFCSESFF